MTTYKTYNDWQGGNPSVVCDIYSYGLFTDENFIYDLFRQINPQIKMDSECLLMIWPITSYEKQINPLNISQRYKSERFKNHFIIQASVEESLRIYKKCGDHESWLWIPAPQTTLFLEMIQWIKTYQNKVQENFQPEPGFDDILKSYIQFDFAVGLNLNDWLRILSKGNTNWEILLKNIGLICDRYTVEGIKKNKKILKKFFIYIIGVLFVAFLIILLFWL